MGAYQWLYGVVDDGVCYKDVCKLGISSMTEHIVQGSCILTKQLSVVEEVGYAHSSDDGQDNIHLVT